MTTFYTYRDEYESEITIRQEGDASKGDMFVMNAPKASFYNEVEHQTKALTETISAFRWAGEYEKIAFAVDALLRMFGYELVKEEQQ